MTIPTPSMPVKGSRRFVSWKRRFMGLIPGARAFFSPAPKGPEGLKREDYCFIISEEAIPKIDALAARIDATPAEVLGLSFGLYSRVKERLLEQDGAKLVILDNQGNLSEVKVS